MQALLDQDYHNATIYVRVDVSRSGTVSLNFLDADMMKVASASQDATGERKQRFEFATLVVDPQKWTVETPYLYTMILSLDNKHFMMHRVTFR